MGGCKIAIEKPQKHQRSGNPFRIRISVTVPPEHELVVTRESSEGDLHEQLPAVIRGAFSAMRRQLRKLVEKQHGDVKKSTGTSRWVDCCSGCFREQEYGFIKSPAGEEVYFHKNSLAGDDFDRLEVGTGVQWHQQEGNKGPQASTVRIVNNPGR